MGFTDSSRRSLSRAGSTVAERLEGRVASRPKTQLPPVRVTVVFLQWDAVRGTAALAALDRRLADLSGLEVHRYIVDNAATEALVERRPDGGVAVSGDNHAREFSGLSRGIAQARADGAVPDVWLLANDRFHSYRYPFLERLSTGTVEAAHVLQGIVGRVDGYPGAVESFGLDVSRWVNTAFYLVPEAVLERVGGPVMIDSDRLGDILPEEYPVGPCLFPASGPVGERHGRYVSAFLTHGPDAPHGAHWYRRLDVSEETWPEFRGKVMSILNEQLFSAQARAAGIPLVEMALADRLGRLGVHNPVVSEALRQLRESPDSEALHLCRLASRISLAVRAARHSPVPFGAPPAAQRAAR